MEFTYPSYKAYSSSVDNPTYSVSLVKSGSKSYATLLKRIKRKQTEIKEIQSIIVDRTVERRYILEEIRELEYKLSKEDNSFVACLCDIDNNLLPCDLT